MIESGDLQHSLAAATGFTELGLAFLALACYCLAFNGALGAQARLIAAATALLSGAGFAFTVDPWVHGVVLLALGVAAVGAFVGAVWAVSTACGLVSRRARAPREAFDPMATPARPQDARQPSHPAVVHTIV